MRLQRNHRNGLFDCHNYRHCSSRDGHGHRYLQLFAFLPSLLAFAHSKPYRRVLDEYWHNGHLCLLVHHRLRVPLLGLSLLFSPLAMYAHPHGHGLLHLRADRGILLGLGGNNLHQLRRMVGETCGKNTVGKVITMFVLGWFGSDVNNFNLGRSIGHIFRLGISGSVF